MITTDVINDDYRNLMARARIVFNRSIRGECNSRVAQALTAIVLGDYVSAYLGLLYGLDPTPVDAISRLKASLAEAEVDAS